MEFTQHRKKQLSEMRPYVEGEDMTGVSISEPDRENGSPMIGDWIARNPTNHNDVWLVSASYYEENFEPVY
jgi:hypothetical protein